MTASGPFRIRVRIDGELGPALAEVFGDLRVTAIGDGTTVLEGDLVDQPAVHGLLGRIRDLGLSLLEVETVAATSRTSGKRAICRGAARGRASSEQDV